MALGFYFPAKIVFGLFATVPREPFLPPIILPADGVLSLVQNVRFTAGVLGLGLSLPLSLGVPASTNDLLRLVLILGLRAAPCWNLCNIGLGVF